MSIADSGSSPVPWPSSAGSGSAATGLSVRIAAEQKRAAGAGRLPALRLLALRPGAAVAATVFACATGYCDARSAGESARAGAVASLGGAPPAVAGHGHGLAPVLLAWASPGPCTANSFTSQATGAYDSDRASASSAQNHQHASPLHCRIVAVPTAPRIRRSRAPGLPWATRPIWNMRSGDCLGSGPTT